MCFRNIYIQFTLCYKLTGYCHIQKLYYYIYVYSYTYIYAIDVCIYVLKISDVEK